MKKQIPLEVDYSTSLGVMLAKEKVSPIDGVATMSESEKTKAGRYTFLSSN